MLIRARRPSRVSPEQSALYVLAIGSFLSALLITGYRGIYTNWIWLAAAAAWAPPLIAQRRKLGSMGHNMILALGPAWHWCGTLVLDTSGY